MRSAKVSAGTGWAYRVRGAVLLAACGDAVGAAFEGRGAPEPAELDAWLDASRQPLRWTDDTALMLVLAEHLARRAGTVDQDALVGEFAAEWARDPHRGYGAGAAALFAQVADGMPWQRAASGLFDDQGSFGNGAAMRVAPIGLLPGLGLSAVAGRARRSAMVTHAHPLAQDGAVAQAVAVALAIRSAESEPPDADRFVVGVAAQVQTAQFRSALQPVPGLVRQQATPGQVAAAVGNDVTAVASVPAALAAFLRHPDDPREAVRFAVLLGGDTDTIAAMTGAMCGARCGEKAVPAMWGLRLEAVSRLWTVAGRLANALAQCG